MKPIKRSFTIAGHRTSISLEQPFWTALKDVAAEQRQPLAQIIQRIDQERGDANLSSAVRVFLLAHYRERR
ncbi:MAG: ribbon-helix-helix domain-containing protein [Hyphomicrobiales bacterium]|nr:ribbon-helix-helix domain-containing protein [Hyphomicrobiales bacterium]